ncbi:MAG: RagB/SusD family nutrient uptake outer membrane protein [Bacteroidales bacterium]|nr:RagB/SusD family nutrient uptake outer membrane protein [Bacteroidales bacterium]
MKSKIYKIASVALLGSSMLMSTSCNDWLGLSPESSVTATDYWKTESDVASAMTGIYCSWVNATNRIFMHGEMRADYLAPYNTNDAYTNIRECNIASTNTWVAWQAYYTVINNCNLLLEKSDEALAADASFSATACEQYKAAATTVRALMYFYLIRVYKDVPYVTWAYFSDETNRNCAVTKQAEILDDLISQLEKIEAAGSLPYSYSSTNVAANKGQVTMYFLKTLLADMYRWQGALATDKTKSQTAYQKCVDECNSIIASGQYTLIPITKQLPAEAGVDLEDVSSMLYQDQFYLTTSASVQEMFNAIYVTGNSSESIFELQIDTYSATPFYSMLIASNRPYVPNSDLLDESVFLDSEKLLGKVNGYEDVRRLLNNQGNGGYCWKYAGMDMNATVYSAASEFEKNIMVYRLAEVYLMKAEALVQLAWANDEDPALLLEAYKAVFKVRDRASAVETTDVTVNNAAFQDVYWNELRNDQDFTIAKGDLTCQSMEQFVLDEEGREMAFEGRRWFDVLRTAARNSYGKGSCTGGGIGYLLNIVTSATTITKASSVRSRYSNYYECHYLPYPRNDVKMNALLDQKSDWEMAE